MDYNKNAAQNVVLYLSHRELIQLLFLCTKFELFDFTFPIGN